jgi:hypothetical protein
MNLYEYKNLYQNIYTLNLDNNNKIGNYLSLFLYLTWNKHKVSPCSFPWLDLKRERSVWTCIFSEDFIKEFPSNGQVIK